MSDQDFVLVLKEQGCIGDFEVAQVHFLAQRAFPDDSESRSAFAVLLSGLSARLRQGSTVAQLRELLVLWPEEYHLAIRRKLEFVAAHSGPAQIFSLIWMQEPQSTDSLHPLVIQGLSDKKDGITETLWGFSRMWVAETELAQSLQVFLNKELHYPRNEEEHGRFCQALRLATPLFVPHVRQWMAVLHAMVSPFCVISGGPGTGKTTIVRMMVLAIGHYRNIAVSRMALCAPTGRAKARLLQGVLDGADAGSPLRALVSRTLHSLLGLDSNGEPRWNHENPLPYDLVVVDESSMVDVWMFARLLDALHPRASLILVGDMDQLPSVEAGAVLGDLTSSLHENGEMLSWPAELREHFHWLLDDSAPRLPGLNEMRSQLAAQLDLPEVKRSLFSGKVSFLTENQRSKEHPEILKWWHALPAVSPLYNPTLHYPELTALFADSQVTRYLAEWELLVESNWSLFARGKSPAQITEISLQQLSPLLGFFMILCCVNDGPMGRHSVNPVLEARFRHLNCAPVIVERNTPLGDFTLYNGDLGLRFSRHGLDFGVFPVDGRVRCVELRRLPEWNLAYAITVHKSQGSEFRHVLLLLPDADQEVSRQLVYTGVTRARSALLVNDPADRLSAELKSVFRRSRFVDVLSDRVSG